MIPTPVFKPVSGTKNGLKLTVRLQLRVTGLYLL